MFLNAGGLTPSVQLARNEGAQVAWLPLTQLTTPEALERDSVHRPLTSFVRTDDPERHLTLSELFPHAKLWSSSVRVRLSPVTSDERHPSSSLSSSAAGVRRI